MKQQENKKDLLKLKLENEYLREQATSTSGLKKYLYKILVAYFASILFFLDIGAFQILFYPLIPILFLLENRFLKFWGRITKVFKK